MAFIHTGPCTCARPGCGRTWLRDPVLEVTCPDCGAPIGVRCRRPSGHSGPMVKLHAARDLLADRIGAYGHCPLGRCGAAQAAGAAAEQHTLFKSLATHGGPPAVLNAAA